MADYKIVIRSSAAKELDKVNIKDKARIVERIRTLASDPRPSGSQKLSGEEKYRIRQGNFRILYEVNDTIITVVVVKIGHRKDVYRK